MKMNTSELTNLALNWAVATCEGYEGAPLWVARQSNASTDWEQGGPIIEREGISLYLDTNNLWQANIFDGNPICNPFGGVQGPTPLIAAMRCYVASRLGDEVDVPDELLHRDGRAALETFNALFNR